MSDWKVTQLIRYSWAVVREDRVFLIFPVLSALSMLLVIALTLGGLYGNGFFGRFDTGTGEERHILAVVTGSLQSGNVLDLVIAVSGYVLATFVAIYCNATMFAAAFQRLDGERPSFRRAVGRVNRVLPELFGWSCFSATFGIVINYLIHSNDLYTKIPGIILSFVWSFTTYFVTPILVLEGLSPFDAMKRSTVLLKTTWGKQLKSRIGFSVGYLGLFVPLFVACMAGGAIAPVVGLAVMLVYLPFLVAGLVVLAAMEGVFNAALFSYATTGKVGRDYPADFIRGAWNGKFPPPPLPNRPGTKGWDKTSWPLKATATAWPARPTLPANEPSRPSGSVSA